MESLREMFLEDPLYVYLTLLLAEFVLFGVWHARRTPKTAALLAIPLVLFGAVWGLERLVVTDREEILAATQEIARDFKAGKLETVDKYIDKTYYGFCGERDELLDRAAQESENYEITSIKIVGDEIEITGQRAEMKVTSVIRLKGDFSATISLKWTVHWVKRPEGWRISEVTDPTPTIPGF